MNRLRKLLLDTALLTGVGLLMRLLGMGFSVYLSKLLGAAGVGLFELLMSVYGMAVVLAVSGIRLSAIRLVVEHGGAARSVMALCIRYALTLGGLACAALMFSARLIAQSWLDAPETELSLRILALSLPFIAVSAALSGYFTAARKASRYAFVQVAEQLCRIALSVILLRSLLQKGINYACVALVIANCGAESLSLLLTYLLYRWEQLPYTIRRPKLLGELLAIALPDAVGSWVRSALLTAKQLLIPRGLRAFGASPDSALATYGVIQGMALPVLSFPAAFLGALAGLLIPEVAECHASGKQERMRYIIRRVVHVTLLFSFGAMGLLLAFAQPLGTLLYNNREAVLYIRLLAPIAPLIYLDITVDAFLKGLGLQTASMRYNIIDAAMCLTLVLVLIPRIGIPGYLAMIGLSETLNLILSIGKLRRVTGFEPEAVHNVLLPAAAALIPLLWGELVYNQLCYAMPQTGALIAAMLWVTAGYWATLFLLGAATPEDWHWFKSIFK
ncbi:MAG: oligosaccharide flippase family protein [Clostridiaceae bacterium]|nr:oligosaccharide flippase family protein [Clostridiaceae bacterium]